jgi:hypothetical protein
MYLIGSSLRICPKQTNRRVDIDIENQAPAMTASSMWLWSGKQLQAFNPITLKKPTKQIRMFRVRKAVVPLNLNLILNSWIQYQHHKTLFNIPHVAVLPTSTPIPDMNNTTNTYNVSDFGTYDELLENMDTGVGSNNARFPKSNVKVLLDAIENSPPTGKAQWDNVATYYNNIYKSNPHKIQNLWKKFNHLANHLMSLDDDNMLPEMRCAKTLLV